MTSRAKYDWQDAFEWYAALDPHERSYRAVAEHIGGSCRKRTVEEAALRERWTERVREIDEKARLHAESLIIRDRGERVRDTLKIIDAARTRFAGQLGRADFRLTGSDFVGLIKLEQLLEGAPTDLVAVAEVQAGFRTAMSVAIAVAEEVALEMFKDAGPEFVRAFRLRFLPAVNEALAIGGGE